MHLSNYVSQWKLETKQGCTKKWFASGHMRNTELHEQTMKTYSSYRKIDRVSIFIFPFSILQGLIMG